MIRYCMCCGCQVNSDAESHTAFFCAPPNDSRAIDWSVLCGRGSLRPTKRTIRQATSAVASGALYRADAEEVLRRAGAGSYWL